MVNLKFNLNINLIKFWILVGINGVKDCHLGRVTDDVHNGLVNGLIHSRHVRLFIVIYNNIPGNFLVLLLPVHEDMMHRGLKEEPVAVLISVVNNCFVDFQDRSVREDL